MVEPRQSSLGDNELDLLKMLWEHGPGTVREINAWSRRQGRRWAYTTVLTMLQRLEAKGFVSSDKSGMAHVFRPMVTRDKLLRQRLKEGGQGVVNRAYLSSGASFVVKWYRPGSASPGQREAIEALSGVAWQRRRRTGPVRRPEDPLLER